MLRGEDDFRKELSKLSPSEREKEIRRLAQDTSGYTGSGGTALTRVAGRSAIDEQTQREQEAGTERPTQRPQNQGVDPGSAILGGILTSNGSAGVNGGSLLSGGAGGFGELIDIGTGSVQGPLTEGQTDLAAGGQVAGGIVAANNVLDAGRNIFTGSRGGKGAVEGAGTVAGTTAGAIAGSAVGLPWLGAGVGSVIGRTAGRGLASVGDRLGFIGQKSTKEIQQERWKNSFDNAATDQDRAAVEYFADLKLNKNTNQVFEEGPLAGRQYSWDEVKNVADYKDVWGSQGFFEAFPDWISGYSEEERRLIANAAVDNDLITSSKGGLIFSDENEAKILDIARQVKAGEFVPTKTDEQRWADKQAFLQELANTQGYQSPELGMPYVPPEEAPAPTDPQGDPVSSQPAPVGGGRPNRPAPPPQQVVPEEPPLIPGGPTLQPEPKTAEDYANAYLDIYRANSSAKFTPYDRSY